MDNRYLLAGGVGALVVAAVAAAFLFMMPRGAQTGPAAGPPAAADERAQILAVRPDDRVMGSADAPVTIVEYASSGCGACAAFHQHTLPRLKSTYIDTGKVRYVLREYSLDNVAAAASMVARCLPPEQFFPFMDILFASQPDWHKAEGQPDAIAAVAARAGLSRERVESCLKDEAELKRLNAVRDEASSKLQVQSTPTLFVNGEMHAGALPFEQLDEIVKSKLPK